MQLAHEPELPALPRASLVVSVFTAGLVSVFWWTGVVDGRTLMVLLVWLGAIPLLWQQGASAQARRSRRLAVGGVILWWLICLLQFPGFPAVQPGLIPAWILMMVGVVVVAIGTHWRKGRSPLRGRNVGWAVFVAYSSALLCGRYILTQSTPERCVATNWTGHRAAGRRDALNEMQAVGIAGAFSRTDAEGIAVCLQSLPVESAGAAGGAGPRWTIDATDLSGFANLPSFPSTPTKMWSSGVRDSCQTDVLFSAEWTQATISCLYFEM